MIPVYCVKRNKKPLSTYSCTVLVILKPGFLSKMYLRNTMGIKISILMTPPYKWLPVWPPVNRLSAVLSLWLWFLLFPAHRSALIMYHLSQFPGFATATGRIRCRHEIIPKGQAKFYLQLFTSIIYNSHLLVMLCTIIQFIYSITSESQFL